MFVIDFQLMVQNPEEAHMSINLDNRTIGPFMTEAKAITHAEAIKATAHKDWCYNVFKLEEPEASLFLDWSSKDTIEDFFNPQDECCDPDHIRTNSQGNCRDCGKPHS